MGEDHEYPYVIESVDNAARTLLMLREKRSLRTVDVARELGVARSTAHRMLSTLVHAGLLRRGDADKAYWAGHLLITLAHVVVDSIDIREEIAPLLSELASTTGETTHFLIRDRDEMIFVDVSEGMHIIRAASRVGTKLKAHVTSAGKALLALMHEHEFDQIYPPGQALRGGTTDAIQDRDQLKAELRRVAAQGWALNESESEPGLIAIAAPVSDGQNVPVGSISISGPAERMREKIPHIRRTLLSRIADFESGLRTVSR